MVVDGEDGSVRTFYKGYINDTTSAPSRTKIAVSVVECLEDTSEGVQAWKLSKEEAESLGQISHPNLVKLLGYCCEDNRSLLVFEYLHKSEQIQFCFAASFMFLSTEEEALPWETRVKIAIGIAQGTAFLHSIKNSPLNQELRMHNIVVDEEYNAKLFYLGSEKERFPNDWTFVLRDLEAIYMAHEYLLTGRSVMETDVFAFGVILLMLFTGSKEIAKNQRCLDRTIPLLIGETIDPRLGRDYPVNAATKMGTLIQRCTMQNRKERPLMQQVLDCLNDIAEIKD